MGVGYRAHLEDVVVIEEVRLGCDYDACDVAGMFGDRLLEQVQIIPKIYDVWAFLPKAWKWRKMPIMPPMIAARKHD